MLACIPSAKDAICRTASAMHPICETERWASAWSAAIWFEISCVALAVWAEQSLDLGRHDSEPASGLSGVSGFYGCVQGEEICLLGDLRDHIDDRADCLARLEEAPDMGH
jgi:hypothetical protein